MLYLGGREECGEQKVSFPGEIKAYMAYQPLAPKLNIALLLTLYRPLTFRALALFLCVLIAVIL